MAQHRWRKNDSLSNLAEKNGFGKWERIWDDPANSELKAKRGTPDKIRVGDILEIPERELAEVSKSTDAEHQFERIGVPPASIKFIFDNGDPRTNSPRELNRLEVSTFVTTRRLPAGFLSNSTDPRNFKIEVYDQGATGSTINAELEAMKPALDADNKPRKDAEGDIIYESFGTPRKLTVQLKKVPGLDHIYRSKHLRLVTDNEDKASKPTQTLLTDHDPDALYVEILDQRVDAKYPAVSGEPLANEATIGRNRLRFRCKVFVCRTSFGAAGLVGGVSTDDVKRHMFAWVRRTYAAANMAPLLVDGEVVQVDPVENLLWIRGVSRRNARGNRDISFRINTTPPTDVSIRTNRGETPRQIADRLRAAAVAALPASYSVEVFDNPPGYNRAKSSDILIKNGANRVILSRPTSRDNRIRVSVGRVRPNATDVATTNFSNVGSADNRALIRNYRTGRNAVAVFVIGRFRSSVGAVGFAYGKQFRERSVFQGEFPVAGSCFVEARTTSTADQRVHTTDHEIGHILIDMIHFSGRSTELMTDAPVQVNNNVNDSKRLSDRIIPYSEFVRGRTRSFPINPNHEIRTRETRFIESWNAFLSRP